MVTGSSEVGIPEDIRDIVKQASSGLLSLIDSEVLPMEQQLGDMLTDERKFFDERGKAVDAVMEARKHVRMKSAEAGYYGMFAPESVGGGELGIRPMVFVEEAMYRKYGPGRPLITWAKGFLSQPTIASFVDGPSHMLVGVSESVRKEFLPLISSGEKTVCFALSEANAGSDVWGLQTKARRDGDDWIINGSKQWITNSPYADYAVVFAVTNEEMVKQRKGGISAFFVETTAQGYSFDGVLPVMGHTGGDCGAMTFEDVRVPADRMVGVQDQGFAIAMFGISEGRTSISANCIGMCEYALDRSLEYSQQRRSFGSPISEYQAIQFMLADMAIDIFTMKYMVLQTAALIESAQKTGKLPVKEISIAKAYAVEKTQECYDRAIQVHGGMGLTNELPLNEGFRIARTLRIPDGTGEIQRRTIARQMLRGDVVF
ncbi:MAG TPA: acyl-CoA dehydrogenase family protein [Dehalococcoidia bacterium]|jgi:acyl-CoA dehydrogenase|nr:acyl-CoA dehydrogenase family protein [Dehalococcoidia bacterium]